MHRVLHWVLKPPTPTAAWLLVLSSIFVIEYVIMTGLDSLPFGPGSHFVKVLDAAILTLVAAPILWWFVVRPLQEVLRLRTRHLADLFESVEEERRRVARELHDGVGQSLTMLISGMKSASESCESDELKRRCNDLKTIAKEALDETKRINQGLRPSLLDDLGLTPAVSRLAEEVGHRHSLEVAVDCHDLGGRRLPEPVESAAFRIVQEALNNVVKHAEAGRAWVEVMVEDDELRLTVEDNGRGLPRPDPGFRQRLATVLRSHEPVASGLTGMRERAQLLGGRFEVRSRASGGTRVTATFPIGESFVRPDSNHAR
ncbi:MAG: sensor histidine kinase [Isosphaeraceae bacterium]